MKRFHPTILIVDDDPNDLLFIQSAFRAANVPATIQAVMGGEEAIAYLKGEGKYTDREIYRYPDFLITDLKMPGVDGYAVIEYIRQNSESAVIPTIVLSGSQDNDDIKKSYLLGASSYHVKPSSPPALRALVKSLYEYWTLCEVPEADSKGKQLETESTHKLGERFSRRAH